MDSFSPENQISPAPRKRNSACTRCRLQKVRCGNQQPSCSNCVKAGVACIRPGAPGVDSEATKQYVRQLEQRTQWLEDVVRRVSPDTLSQVNPVTTTGISNVPPLASQEARESNVQPVPTDHQRRQTYATSLLAPGQNTQSSSIAPVPKFVSAASPSIESPAASTSSRIGPGQPLAHDVGLLSLANSAEPKYVGPSSGVTFARLVFAAAPQSQGLPSTVYALEEGINAQINSPDKLVELAELPPEDEMSYFVDAYFETWHPIYPFLHEELFQGMVTRVQMQARLKTSTDPQLSLSMDLAQLFLVIALGAKVLESRLSTAFSSESYYATAMSHVAKIPLHDSIRGVQVLLLLALSSFSFVNGLNAWFLTSTILASCLDLGLQRKHIDGRFGGHLPENEELLRTKQLRSAVFWSAYSLDRTLCVILGRPLTLRDEAIDIQYPDEWETEEIDHSAIPVRDDLEPKRKRICLPQSPYTAGNYSFRYDRITAEIKLMLYRVAQSPARFPWPVNLADWQAQTDLACRELLDNARQDLKWRGLVIGRGAGLKDRTVRLVELKFHHCMMLLNRPSPAIPQPSPSSLITCYDSAIATIRIQSELARFANMTNSWLTAHAVFVSGITMLYCLWTSPDVRKKTTLSTFEEQSSSCTKLLSTLGKTWSVSKNARDKFNHLVRLTSDSWKSKSGTITPAQQNREVHTDIQQMSSMDNYGVPQMDNFSTGMWDDLNVDWSVPPNMLTDQLGDMRAWFDLDWLHDANLYL